MINYFFHYTFNKDGKTGDGNIFIGSKGMISEALVREVENLLKEEDGYSSVVVNNFIEMP